MFSYGLSFDARVAKMRDLKKTVPTKIPDFDRCERTSYVRRTDHARVK